ncbi:MAG: hypothetical protein QOG09_567 [Solirubrobacterales bacterium]|nr:hypothetical protein [Solirubrobacterales bacterium]
MSIAGSIFLVAAGAILRYAVTFEISGVDREAVGLILMIAGFAGLAFSLLFELIWSDRERNRPPDDRTRRLR